MDRQVSPTLFLADFSDALGSTSAGYSRIKAKDAGFDEAWLQRAIAANPELVIAPCREAGLTDESWAVWDREVRVDPAGSVDVLLVSASGRIAVVETKLSYNPEARRSVVAQVLDYAIHFPMSDTTGLPALPDIDGHPLGDDDVQRRIQEGDYLLIVAGDELDDRAVKLGRSVLGRHLVHGWTLAMVEVSVYRPSSMGRFLLVPHIRGAVVAEQRQVVRIVIDGERTRVSVDQGAPVAGTQPMATAYIWDEARFLSNVRQNDARMVDATQRLIAIAKRFGTLEWKSADFRGKLGKLNIALPAIGPKPLMRLYAEDGNLAIHTTAPDKSAIATAARKAIVDRLAESGFITLPIDPRESHVEVDFDEWADNLGTFEAVLAQA